MIEAQADAENAKLEMELRKEELALRRQMADNDFQKNMLEVAARREESQVSLQVSQQQRDLQLIKIAADQQKTVQQVRKDLAIADVTEGTKRLAKEVDFQMFREEIEQAKRTGKGI
jgi:hypothetical protein